MKVKKFISILLTLILVLSTVQLSIGMIASAITYDGSVLGYMLENYDYYREDRYKVNTYANYTAALAAANTVAASTVATDAQCNDAALNLASAEAGLTLLDAPYKSKLNFRCDNTVLSGESTTIRFRDEFNNELTDISIEAENATVGDAVFGADNYYSAVVTATGATGSLITLTVTYTYDSVVYTSRMFMLIAADGTAPSGISRAQLGAALVREIALNRQESEYYEGFSTYLAVIKASATVYLNPTSTQTKIDRAAQNIIDAVNGLPEAGADYSRIYSLIAYANELAPENYNSFKAVTDAIALVEYDLLVSYQEEVNLMADAIEEAINSLTLKTARYTVICETEDGTQLSSERYDGKRTYVVRVTAPIFPGYEANMAYQTVVLDRDESTVTFVYSPVTYYVYFDANGGSCNLASKPLTYDAEYGELPVATRDGYEFLGWYSDPYGGEEIVADTMVTINYVDRVYARWSDVESYTFRFDSGSGSACEDINATYGDAITMPVPERYGYDFLGWYYQPEYTQIADYDTMPDVGADGAVVMLYAKWGVRTYDVTLDAGENGVIASTTHSVTYGSTYGIIPTPTKEGHTFAGWYTEAEGGTPVVEATPVELENAHTIYAHYTVNSYTLYFDMDGGVEIAPITQDYGTPVTLANAPTKEYYLFAGWTLNGQAFELDTMPAGNVTIKAVWTLNTVCEYYLDAYKTVDGVKIPAKTVNPGEIITVNVSLKTNYPAGAGVFGILFDKRVFETTAAIGALCVENTGTPYFSTLSSSAIGGNINLAQSSWASLFDGDPDINGTNYQFMRLTTPTFKNTNTPVVISEKTLIFYFTLRVKATLPAGQLSAAICIDERACKSTVNTGSKYHTSVALQKVNPSTGLYATSDTNNLVPNCDNARVEVALGGADSELAAKTGSTTVVDYTEGYVYGLAQELTLDSFKNDYATVIGTGTIECDDTVLRTGSVIRVMNGGVCRAQYTVIIFGDVDSNGMADGSDSFYVDMIVNGMLSADALTAAQKLAADPNHDGVIDAADAILLADAGLLKQIVTQTLPA